LTKVLRLLQHERLREKSHNVGWEPVSVGVEQGCAAGAAEIDRWFRNKVLFANFCRMADKKKMSVAEILAAARKADSKEGAPSPKAESAPAAEAEASPEQPAVTESVSAAELAPVPAANPVAKPAAGGARPSVKDILAMARAGKAGGAATPAAGTAAPAAEKPAPKPAAAKPAAAAATAKPAAAKAVAKPAVAVGAKDTASILAAARKGAKPGPITKAEAAAVAAKAPAKAPPKEKIVVPPMPAKPAYAKVAPAKASLTEETRRGFFSVLFGSSLAVGMTSMAATVGLWTLGTARFMFPNILTEPPSRFKVGFKDNFAPGQVETKFVATNGVWVCNYEYNGQPQIYALKTVCTHLGCTPNWLEGEQKFKCPCHGSGFYKDGINFEGPAPRPLERYAIRIGDDGQLEIDKSKTFQEELGQWTDPDCFVTV
jgi:cytochrome b6-f complex iron-sulfur subunit